MKNIRIRSKLALGFGALVVIILSLGSMALWQMLQVSYGAKHASELDLPILTETLDAERSLHDAKYTLGLFALTGKESTLREGLQQADTVKSRLQQAIDHIGDHSALTEARERLTKSIDYTTRYAAVMEQIGKCKANGKAIHTEQEQRAAQVLTKAQDYIQRRRQAFDSDTQTAATRRDVAAISLMRDVVDATNRLQVMHWTSHAVRKPALAAAGEEHFAIIDRSLTELLRTNTDPAVAEQLGQIKKAAGQYKAATMDFIANETRIAELNVKSDAALKVADKAVEGAVEACTEQALTTAMQASQNITSAFRIVVTGLAIAVFVSLGVTLYLTHAITQPIQGVVSFANEMAKGNFSQRLDADRRDEAGTLARAMNTVVENLQAQVSQIQEAASILGASAGEISTSVTQVTSGARETATAVTQTTATVEQVKQGAHLTSEKSRGVSESAQRGFQTAQTGRQATETVADGMTRINEQMTSIADTIMKLGEQSQAIGDIISTVDDIAEQSNLLAVNAAVEAARAGEHGKGFAVVAQEIKTMAEQSKHATKQVRTILNDIQKATGAAVMATEQGSKAVDQGLKESLGANESIQALSNSFTEAVQSAGQIAVSTQEQLTGMDQVAQAMQSIKEASQQNVESMVQLQTAAHRLKDVGSNLTESVARFAV